MEYLLDAGKAVTCINLIKKERPCQNLYCQNCVIAFMVEKHNYEDNEEEEEKSSKEDDQKSKELEERKLKHKLWLKAVQNILFVCPCCQGYCLNDDKPQSRKLDFS